MFYLYRAQQNRDVIHGCRGIRVLIENMVVWVILYADMEVQYLPSRESSRIKTGVYSDCPNKPSVSQKL